MGAGFPDYSVVLAIRTPLVFYAADALTGLVGVSLGGVAWPTANLALYEPFTLNEVVTIKSILLMIGTSSGNLCVALYSEAGVRIVTSGSIPVGAAGAQIITITPTVLAPGRYYAGLAADNTIMTMRMRGLGAGLETVCGTKEQAAAFPLPDPATMADNPAGALVPLIGLSLA